ncbi:hypothetical protein [Fodinibius saliphilus]|uniref:hypothetical protein n=1 Tax=Fodinibius saliphilus TaxID=1920650 RepID=UPI001FE3D02E|nr:hypothetical protein [Fodinibius saliphilus]
MQRLRKHPLVDHVVKDVYYKAIQYREAPTESRSSEMMASQATPWGINRVNGPLPGGSK